MVLTRRDVERAGQADRSPGGAGLSPLIDSVRIVPMVTSGSFALARASVCFPDLAKLYEFPETGRQGCEKG
jgi:hypothetical protein